MGNISYAMYPSGRPNESNTALRVLYAWCSSWWTDLSVLWMTEKMFIRYNGTLSPSRCSLGGRKKPANCLLAIPSTRFLSLPKSRLSSNWPEGPTTSGLNRSSAQPHVATHPPRQRLGQVQGKNSIRDLANVASCGDTVSERSKWCLWVRVSVVRMGSAKAHVIRDCDCVYCGRTECRTLCLSCRHWCRWPHFYICSPRNMVYQYRQIRWTRNMII